MTEARVTGTGHLPKADDPVWFRVAEPTAAQVADAIAVADSKVHGGIGFSLDYATGKVSPSSNGVRKWLWWLKLDKPVSWIHDRTPNLHADEFDPDAGRHVKADSNERLPGAYERPFMKAQGERALHKFVDEATAPDRNRAEYYEDITGVRCAIEYGDLPAAVQAALTCSLRADIRSRLVELLEDELIWWPDFQRPESTSSARTVAPHIPAAPNTSITISATEGGITIGG